MSATQAPSPTIRNAAGTAAAPRSKRPAGDPRRETNALFALSAGSRAEVDEIVAQAVAAGGSHAVAPQDHGFMYGWSFHDPEHYHREVFWMDPDAMGG